MGLLDSVLGAVVQQQAGPGGAPGSGGDLLGAVIAMLGQGGGVKRRKLMAPAPVPGAPAARPRRVKESVQCVAHRQTPPPCPAG